MTMPLPLTRPLSNVGRLYRMYKADTISLQTYIACLGSDTCATPQCGYPATEVRDAVRYCDVCARRYDVIGLPFNDEHEHEPRVAPSWLLRAQERKAER